MKLFNRTGAPLPDHIIKSVKSVRKGSEVGRREFLALASAFGATAATAYGMLGMPAPAYAAETPSMGGTLRIQQEEGVAIQPYWRSLYRHARKGVLNYEMHPLFELHVHKLGFA